MIKNQRGRRNLTDGWKFELAQVEKSILAEIGAAKKVEAGKAARDKQLGVLSIIDKTSSEPKYQGKEPKKAKTDSTLSIIDKVESAQESEPNKHNTQKSIADSLGWSTGKTAMADKVWKDATPNWVKGMQSRLLAG